MSTLPKGVKNSLPFHARVIYLNAFNHAWEAYQDTDHRLTGSSREATAARIAWASVKKMYEKDEASGRWKRQASKAKVRS